MTHDSHESGLRTQKFSPVKSPVISPIKTRQLQYKKVSPAKTTPQVQNQLKPTYTIHYSKFNPFTDPCS